MGADQVVELSSSIAKVYEGVESPDDAPASLCTLESTTKGGDPVWIQVLPGNVNMSYPFTDHPLDFLRLNGVRGPQDLYLIEWAAGDYASFGFSNLPARDHASFVDQLFVKILGCEDGSYRVKTTIELLVE